MSVTLYQLRETIWNYPQRLIGEEDSILKSLVDFYKRMRPFSHLIVFLIFFTFITTSYVMFPQKIISVNTEELVEGVVLGEGGRLVRINPVLATNQQIEKDFNRIIYHELVRINDSGEAEPLLAKSWEKLDEEGKNFRFHLREDVFWHDEEKFTVDDVVTTFDMVKSLDENSSSYAVALKEMQISRIDDFTFDILLSEIRPTLFEDISFGILPEHIIQGESPATFPRHSINLEPIGTGPYIFKSYKDNKVVFERNPYYFGEKAKIKKLTFVFYENIQEAIGALKSGQIHLLADASTYAKEEMKGWNNIQIIKSKPLYRRYWAMYFNLKEGGKDIFKSRAVRQAISAGINRESIMATVISADKEALGPIAENSWAFDKDAKRFTYDVEEAKKLLDEAGWKETKKSNVRSKDDKKLEFVLSYLDQYDKRIVADRIKESLEEVGVIVNLNPVTSDVLNNSLVTPRQFEAVLYGMETTVDPDHIRLWHSDSIQPPGLNISSYQSDEVLTTIVGGERSVVSVIDATLQNGRSSLVQDERIGDSAQPGYARFQKELMNDCPVVFLYHPTFNYLANRKVSGIDLSKITSPEGRFDSIMNWEIEL